MQNRCIEDLWQGFYCSPSWFLSTMRSEWVCLLRLLIQAFLRGCFCFHLLSIHSSDRCWFLHRARKLLVWDAPIDGSACTGEMNQFSVSAYNRQKCALAPAWGLHWCYTFVFISMKDLASPFTPTLHTHTHTQACSGPGSTADCIWLVIVSG